MSRWESWLRADHRYLRGWYVSGTLIASAAVSLIALLGVTWAAGWPRVWQGLLQAHWLWLVLAPLSVLVSYLGYCLPYRQVVRMGRASDLAGQDALAMVTIGFGPFTPRSGFALDARRLSEPGPE